jgi:phage protein D
MSTTITYKPQQAPATGQATTPAAVQPNSANSDFYPVPAGYRRPRGFLKINGKSAAAIDLSVTSTSHFTPDSWTASLGLYDQPQGLDLSFWSALDPSTIVEVRMGFLSQNQSASEFPTSSSVLVTGLIDDIEPDRTSGVVSLSGRDLTARLVDNKTANRYPNVTASDAVTQIAKQFNLTPKVTATTTPIGKYGQDSYASMTGGTAYWDFVTFLAQQENFDAYVTGQTLYFGPFEADADPKPWVFYIRDNGRGGLSGNVKEMQLHRNANLAKDITVTVLSHNSMTGQSLKATASRAGTRVPASSRSSNADTVQNYVIRKPGLTPVQAQNIADAELAEISKFEKEYAISLEGSADLTVRKMTKIIGTNTDFDTKYYIRTIDRTWNAQDGFEMTIHGKNQPPTNGDDDDDGGFFGNSDSDQSSSDDSGSAGDS